MQVLQYLLDDVSEFLSTKSTEVEREKEEEKEKGCLNLLGAFLDHISERERENFRSRREDNENSITLTTIHQVICVHYYFFFQTVILAFRYFKCTINFHWLNQLNYLSISYLVLTMQSKGLEWDIVFIVKVRGMWLNGDIHLTKITMPCINVWSMAQANESEIPLLHEFNGVAKENGSSVEVSLFRELFILSPPSARII